MDNDQNGFQEDSWKPSCMENDKLVVLFMMRELFNNERRWIAVERDDIIPFVVIEVVLLDRSREVSGSFDFFSSCLLLVQGEMMFVGLLFDSDVNWL